MKTHVAFVPYLSSPLMVLGLAALEGCGAAPTDDELADSVSNALSANSAAAYNYFVNKGLSKPQSAGIVGNLIQESNVNPRAVQSGGPGRGIAQWSQPGRWNDLVAYAGNQDPWNLNVQLGFIWHELPWYGLSRLRATTNVGTATIAFEKDYEICGDCQESKRIHYAEDVLAAYGGGTTTPVGVSGTASVYGVLSDGRLTYTAINAASGDRTHGAVTSAANLGFSAKAIATLNFNTLLITSTGGQLYRVDVVTNNTSLVFKAPVGLGYGWTHDLLAFDGTYLYGIAGGALRRYRIAVAKPAASDITNNVLIDSGFTLKTLTATGLGWILGTTSDGKLLSYQIRGSGDWSRYELRSSTWQVFTQLLSPGGGVYYGQGSDGSMNRYLDASPFDGDGGDIAGFTNDPVDANGWTQTLLSAQPNTVTGT